MCAVIAAVERAGFLASPRAKSGAFAGRAAGPRMRANGSIVGEVILVRAVWLQWSRGARAEIDWLSLTGR